MPNPTLGQKIEPNPYNWTSPFCRHDSTVEWVADNGYGVEDWNFAIDQAIDGFVYGFGQGNPSETRRKQAGDRFDVLFYTFEDGDYRAVGLYLSAHWLSPEELHTTRKTKGWKRILKRRQRQLLQAVGKTRGQQTFESYCKLSPFKWRVRVEDVVTFPDRPVFTPPFSALRDTNAHNWAEHPWTTLLDVPDLQPTDTPPSTVEGPLKTRAHTSRERDPGFIAALKRRRLAAEGALRCEACGFDFAQHYALGGRVFLEGHHTCPLHLLPEQGGIVTEADIALLCANCHRVAHLMGAYTVEAIQALLTSPASPDAL